MQIARAEASLEPKAGARTLELGTLLALTWVGALAAQHLVAHGLAWIALDVLGHGAAAGLYTVGLLPRFGARPIVAAVLAGTLIDLDHAVAAGSLDPMRMASLAARPPTHSLAMVVVLGLIAWPLFGSATGYAVAVGVLAHLLGDAVEPGGAPLLFPLVRYPYMHVAMAGLVAATLLTTALSVWFGRAASRDRLAADYF